MDIEFLQPWVTVQGTSPVLTIIQDQEAWMLLQDCNDVTAWVDVPAVSPLASGTLTLTLESSPMEADAFFRPIASAVILSASSTPFVLSSASGAASINPSACLLRWRITSTSGSGTWSVTFRVRVCRSRTSYFTPTQAPGCLLWLRADLGLTTTGAAGDVTAWADQTGKTANNLFNSGNPTLAQGLPAFGNFPAINFAGGAYLVNVSAPAITQPNTVIVVAQTQTVLAANAVLFAGQALTNQTIAETASQASEITINAGASVNVTLGTALNASNASIIQVDWNGASTQVYQNGQAQGGVVNAGTNGFSAAYGVGATAATGLNPYDGWVAEVLVFKPALTAVWRTLITRYLGGRYGFPVT